MFNSEPYRLKAPEYKRRETQTNAHDEIHEPQNLERTFSDLAENEA